MGKDSQKWSKRDRVTNMQVTWAQTESTEKSSKTPQGKIFVLTFVAMLRFGQYYENTSDLDR